MCGLDDEEVQRIIKGYEESIDCIDNVNGLCAEVNVLGSVRVSKDIQKIMLAPEEITPHYKYKLQ